MASHQTEHLQLCQWEAEDEVLRVDFNADNAKIDAAVAGLQAEITDSAALVREIGEKAYSAEHKPFVLGTYAGNGEASRVISLGFTPSAVFVCASSGATVIRYTSETDHFGGLALKDTPVTAVSVVEGGFQVLYDSNNTTLKRYANAPGTRYHYIAFP